MGAVDRHLRHILLPIIGMRVAQPVRIKPQKGIMRKEQRPAQLRPQRQAHAVIAFAIAIIGAGAEALFIDLPASMAWRGAPAAST